MKLIRWIKKNKKISISTLISFIFIITFIVLLTKTIINNEKDKQNRTFLDRDRTEIVCKKNEEIRSARVRYETKNNPDEWIFTLFLYCTDKSGIYDMGYEYEHLQNRIEEKFYNRYEKKMNLKCASIDTWGLNKYSKKWNKKYFIKSNNFDGYFIN